MISVMSSGWHSTIKNTIFGDNVTNSDITSLMVKIGWVYTLFFIAVGYVGKQAAPYGKHAASSTSTFLKWAVTSMLYFSDLQMCRDFPTYSE